MNNSNSFENFERLRGMSSASYSSSKSKASLINDFPWPEPMDSAAYHGLAGEIVDAIDPHTESDRAAILIQLLVAIGNIIGRCGHFVAEADKHYTNLFAVLVGDTSKGRKGSSWGHVQRLFDGLGSEWVKKNIKSGLSSGEGLVWHVRDPSTEADGSNDDGVIDKRLLIVESEFASVLRVVKREGNTLSPVVRDAWDGRILNTLTKHKPATATNSHISIIGHITKTELKRYLSETESANGFGNRFIWVCVKRSKSLPDGGKFHESDFSMLSNRLRDAMDNARKCFLLKRDAEASKIWHSIYDELSEGLPGLVGAMTGRREAQVMRLATIYALLDQSNAIQANHLLAAIALEQYCMNSCKHIFGFELGDPIADTILAALREVPDGLTRTEISHEVFKKNKGWKEITRALMLLQSHDLAHSRKEETDGRDAERWFFGPPIMESTTETTEANKDAANASY